MSDEDFVDDFVDDFDDEELDDHESRKRMLEKKRAYREKIELMEIARELNLNDDDFFEAFGDY